MEHQVIDARTDFSATDLCRLTDLTYRKVDWWCRLGVLIPCSAGGAEPGSGYNRRFDAREVRVAKVVGALASLGVPVQTTLGKVAAVLRETEPWDRPTLWVSRDGAVMDSPWSDGWIIDLEPFAFERPE